MFPRRRLPEELGELVEVHRPQHWAGYLIPAVFSVPLALLAAFGPPGPLVGLGILLLIGLPCAYILAEWFLFQHRIYEHGIVFRTELPGLYSYVVPFSTVDPDHIEVAARRRTPRNEFELAPQHERQNPLIDSTLRFPGLSPGSARKLAKRKITWEEATTDPARYGLARWQATFRHPEAKRRLLADTVRRSRTGGG